ncbi:MAG: hypothetical protein AAGF12_26210 [Myxococcota bacterium]
MRRSQAGTGSRGRGTAVLWALGALAVGAFGLGCASSDRGTGGGSDSSVQDGSTSGCGMCSTFQECCNNVCTPITNDRNNCGGCGITCLPSEECQSTTCVPSCDPACPAGTECRGGTCQAVGGECNPTCPPQQNCCGGTCVNRAVPPGTNGVSDPSFLNCGGCGFNCDAQRATACVAEAGGQPQCKCGDFPQCLEGEECTTDNGTSRCTNVSTDKNNCGMVGNVCPGEEICVAGNCSCGNLGMPCAMGESCCGGTCIDTSNDPENCGACGETCGPNGPSCVGGTCRCGSGAACAEAMPGMFGIGGSLGESCCGGSCVTNDEMNCGCGVVCSGDDMCVLASGGLPIPGLPMGEGLCCGQGAFGIAFCSM